MLNVIMRSAVMMIVYHPTIVDEIITKQSVSGSKHKF
jgi:hypothetical protein